MKFSNKQLIVILFALITFILLISINFNKELYVTPAEKQNMTNKFETWAYEWFSSFAESHIMKGLDYTKGQDFFYSYGNKSGETLTEAYAHHPPGTGLMLSIVYLTFGFNIILSRILSLILYCLTLFFFYKIFEEWFLKNKTWLIFSIIILSIIPLSTIYGKHVIYHDIPALLFIVMGLYYYIKIIEKKETKHTKKLAIAAFIIASFFSESGIIITLLVNAHNIIFLKDKKFKFEFAKWTIIILAVMLIQILLIQGAINGLTTNMDKETAPINVLAQVYITTHTQIYTNIIPIMSLIGFIMICYYEKEKRKKILFLLGIYASYFIINTITLSNTAQAILHPWPQIIYFPIEIILSAYLLNRIYLKKTIFSKIIITSIIFILIKKTFMMMSNFYGNNMFDYGLWGKIIYFFTTSQPYIILASLILIIIIHYLIKNYKKIN